MTTLNQYKEMHRQGHFPGHSTRKNSAKIKELIAKHGAKTILDFGSGKGMQYDEQKLHEEWGVERPYLYDPAVPGQEVLPNALRPFDGVICCDVLEHLEPDEASKAVFDATIRAKKFSFFSIATYPAKKTLPDGRNAHVLIKTEDWWRGFIEVVAFKGPEVVLEFDNGGR